MTAERWRSALGTLQNAIGYGYDIAGRLESAADFSGDIGSAAEVANGLTYDAWNRITSASANIFGYTAAVGSGYDNYGNRVGLSLAAGGVADFLNTSTYDKTGRLGSVTQTSQAGGRAVAAKRVELAYDSAGRLGTLTRRTGSTVTAPRGCVHQLCLRHARAGHPHCPSSKRRPETPRCWPGTITPTTARDAKPPTKISRE